MTSKRKRPQSYLHRKIYEKYYGPIPKDDSGRSYEIHHIDGNHKNNDISNLIAVTIQEHYLLHYSQGDYAASLRIASRMGMTTEEISEIASNNSKKMVKEGIHPFLGGEIQKQTQTELVKKGQHIFQNSDFQRNNNLRRVENGTHHFLGPEINKKMIDAGIHPFKNSELQRERSLKQIRDGTHPLLSGEIQKQTQTELVKNGTHRFLKSNQKEWECNYCGTRGTNSGVYGRLHKSKKCVNIDKYKNKEIT
jgi:hypothetical protein